MNCGYCGANLTIPENMRIKSAPADEEKTAQAKAFEPEKIQPADVLRKAQPIAIRAWNLYALWSWLRWLLPTCLTILVIGFVLCAALGMIPIIWNMMR